MNLVITIKTNQQIMELIKSKHNDESWPACAPKNDPEAKYYRQIEDDLEKAKSALVGGGLPQE